MATQEQWVNLIDGSKILGCSVQTLRRKIKAEEIPARQVTTKFGPAWEIQILRPYNGQSSVEGLDSPTEGSVEGLDTPIEITVPPPESDAIAWLRELQQENRDQAALIGYLQGRVQNLEAQLVAEPPGLKALPDPQPKPWWRRFWQLVSV